MTSIINNDPLELIKKENELHNNEKRMIEINNYYSAKYKAYGKLAIKIAYCLFPIILINILLKYNLIPQSLGHILLSIIIGFTGFYIFFYIINLSYRDNMDFNAYNCQYNTDNTKNIGDVDLDVNLNGDLLWDTCIDEACCDKETQIYDRLKTKCVTIKEGFSSTRIPTRSGEADKCENDNCNKCKDDADDEDDGDLKHFSFHGKHLLNKYNV